MTSRDAERQELERAVALLGKTTRPGRLLEYLGAKYLEQHEGELTEYTIAIEVFGRSEKSFDATADAVVRVEAHRLRKKLREMYEKDDRAQGIQISLPAGTYVPKFTVAPDPPPAVPEPEPAPDATETIADDAVRIRRIPLWAWSLPLVVALAVIVGIALNSLSPDVRAAAPARTPQLVSAAATNGAQTEVHLMSGHTGSEVIDSAGVRWTPDRYFVSGGAWSKDNGFIRGTSRPFLFASWRTGEFGYDIPLAPGAYELRLFFLSPHRAGDEKLGGFNVALHGKPLLTAFDIAQSANGPDVAEEQVFRDVSPDKDGMLRLWFSNHAASPLLNGVELVPGTPGSLRPIRITMQPTSYVDHQGQRWRADDYYLNGFRSTDRRKVTGTKDPELFGAERFGHFSYAIPVDRRGTYTVVLHFAELYHGPQLAGGGGVGSRIFHVFCNGQTLLRDFDVFKEAGSLRVVSKTFPGIRPSAQGKINLMFEPVVNNATVSGIEILDESR
jgi:hypothetical protein